MSERIFNIFVYFNEGIAKYFGIRHHRVSGTDEKKMEYLRQNVSEDHSLAKIFELPRQFTPEQWKSTFRLGNSIKYFEQGFVHYRAPMNPIFCVTSVVDNVIRIDRTIGAEPFRGDIVSAQPGRGAVPDYLVTYMGGGKFQFTQLIYDDYFKAIKILLEKELNVSCVKLLMSCIDTLAFVEFGDSRNNFTKWLDNYVELAPLGITSEELWEFRNSVLHMTNLSSRKVLMGKVSPIMPFVASKDIKLTELEATPNTFNLRNLIDSVNNGIAKWGATYSQNDEKFLLFIERYDLTISDSRVARFAPDKHPDD